MSRAFVAKLESGRVGEAQLALIERVAAALEAELDVRVRWRGGELDRLLDASHASLVERVVTMLQARGWAVEVEASFSIYGERGSIDVLAHHAGSRTLLVVEVKTVIVDAQDLLSALDRKVRLARRIGSERGYDVAAVASLLVVEDGTTNRRRVARLGATFDAVLPSRGRSVVEWLRQPSAAMPRLRGLLFLSSATPGGTSRRMAGRQRVRAPNRAPDAHRREHVAGNRV